jgi:hypothetical protein
MDSCSSSDGLKELTCLGDLLLQTDLLEAAKPRESPNEFSGARLLEGGNISLQNARYRNRVRRSHQVSHCRELWILRR